MLEKTIVTKKGAFAESPLEFSIANTKGDMPISDFKEEFRQDCTRVLLVPKPHIGERIHRSTVAILADGSGRHQLRQGKDTKDKVDYSMGAKNVVKHAIDFFTNGNPEEIGIDKMLALITSVDNYNKRSDKFFEGLTKAFMGFAIQISSEGILNRQGIRLDYAGDLNLEHYTGAKRNLVEIMLAAKEINNRRVDELYGEDDHSKTLYLGFNYGEDVLDQFRGENNEDGVVLIRTGVEQVARFGSTKPEAQDILIAIDELWPEQSPEDTRNRIHAAIKDRVEKTVPKGVETFNDLMMLLESFLETNLNNIQLDIPYASPSYELKVYLQSRSVRNVYIRLQDEQGAIFEYGDPGSLRVISLVPGVGKIDLAKPYDALLTLGQYRDDIVLPENTPLGYSNIYSQRELSPDLAQALTRVQLLEASSVNLKGGNREADHFTKLFKTVEFDSYRGILNLSGESIADLNHRLQSPETIQQRYLRQADEFVAHMIRWRKNSGPFYETDKALRAFNNYMYTTFFLSYAPNVASWDLIGHEWVLTAERTARYMACIYDLDELFDNPDTSKQHVRIMSRLLKATIQLEDISNYSIPNIVLQSPASMALLKEFYALAQDLQASSDEELFYSWQDSMLELIEAHEAENEDVLVNPLLEGIIQDHDSNILKFRDFINNKHLPQVFVSKIEDALLRLQSEDKKTREEATVDLRLYVHLIDIEKSIGSALTYRTMLCVDSKDIVQHGGLLSIFEQIAFLTNAFYRVANDLAELDRLNDDKDLKEQDTKNIILSKYTVDGTLPMSGFIEGIAELKSFADELKAEIDSLREEFKLLAEQVGDRKWLQVALAIIRSDMAFLFYKGTHYRNVTQRQAHDFIIQSFNLGA